MAAPSTDPKQQNVNVADDLTPNHNEQFMAIMIRRDGLADEMPANVFAEYLSNTPLDPQQLIDALNASPNIVTVTDAFGIAQYNVLPL